MGIIQAFSGAIRGTFADQWKEIITAGDFDEYSAVVPGVLKKSNNGRGTNFYGSEGVISEGSKIYVPENTAAFIFDDDGIEEVITKAGGYTYVNGQPSVFAQAKYSESYFQKVNNALLGQIGDRFKFGGQPSNRKEIAFVNLREIRGIKFGTKGPLMYNDIYYGADLAVRAFGKFSLKIIDPVKFIRNYVPANVNNYSFADSKARAQLLSEFLQSFMDALNSLSGKYRVSQIPSQANELASSIQSEQTNSGSWGDRFGLQIMSVAIENIELTEESKALINKYNENKLGVKAYEEVSQHASNVAAQQNISQGIKEHGLGNSAGFVMGMNMGQGMNAFTAEQTHQPSGKMNLDEQIEALKKLKELQDIGILTDEEFNLKKKEIMGL